jgi:hypothetical protein
MEAHHLQLNLRLLLIALGFLDGPVCPAAILAINIDPNDPSVADAAYPGTGSTITTLTDQQTQVTISVAGRQYGNDAAVGSPRWGLQAGPLPWRNSQDGFVVTGGFAPSAAGSTQNASGTGASYVSITLANVQPNTLFENLSVEFEGIAFASISNAWGATSASGFADWSVANLSNNGRRLTLDLADFTWTGAGPLEIRLYGVTAPAQGAFTRVGVNGRLTNLPPIPEPHIAFLLGAAVWVICSGHYRQAGGTARRTGLWSALAVLRDSRGISSGVNSGWESNRHHPGVAGDRAGSLPRVIAESAAEPCRTNRTGR